MAGFVLAATVFSAAPGATASAQTASTAVLVGAGDISNCNTDKDEATAKLLDGIAGTVATLGDNVYPDGTSSQFTDCYHPTWGRHKARTRPSPGNHDHHMQSAAGYFDYFGTAAGTAGQGWYSYELGGWHIIVLNSECSEVGGCDPNSPQGKWLAADLAASTNPCKLAYWHKPLFSSGVHGPNRFMKPLWDALYPAGVDVILNGHDHIYERFARQNPSGQADPAGIRQFTVGTGGGGLTSVVAVQPNSEARNDTVFGVLKLTLQPGRYDWQFVPIAGSTFADTGAGNCGSSGANTAPQANAGPDQQINSSAPATATLNGTASTDDAGITRYAWAKVSGPAATVNSPGSATTTVSLSATGSYTFSLTVTDAAGLTSTDTVLVTLTQTAVTTWSRSISTGAGDAEEDASTGKVILNDDDLDLVRDLRTDKIVGLRFTSVNIPANAVIQSAYLQFRSDENQSEATSLTIQGFATSNLTSFTTGKSGISTRPRTTAITWTSLPGWTAAGLAGSAQRTPNLVGIVQQIIRLPGWAPNNALGFVITGTGKRTADSYEGGFATQLIVTYTLP